MSFADLSLDGWRTLDLATATRRAQEIAVQVAGRVVRVESVEHLGAPLQRVLIERGGRQFALVPGGVVTVGFDLDRWQPSPDQLTCYREQTLAGGFGFDPEPRAYLAVVLSPRRIATVPTVLMAVENEALPTRPDEVPAVLAGEGLRLPGPDEWEHACGAGAGTLFRWGDQCPLDRSPYGDKTGPQHQPNAFGMRIAYDTYQAEMTRDPDSVYGGDGGESVCGGYGNFIEWLPLATANRNPSMAEFIHGPDGEDMYEDFQIRPVLDLT